MTEEQEGDDEGFGGPHDPRIRAAFRAWLVALGSDPEAATAAAMTYESLDAPGRDAWLDAIDEEASSLEVPRVALYAPLFGVENDPGRRARIDAKLEEASAPSPRTLRALRGDDASGEVVLAIVIPLYLDFVELLVCRYHPDRGVRAARRGPLLHATDLFGPLASVREIDGATLVEASFAEAIEDLAHAVVADRREGRDAPEPLKRYDFLFTLGLGDRTGSFILPP